MSSRHVFKTSSRRLQDQWMFAGIAVDLSRQRQLDADSKAIQQIEIVGQLKKLDAAAADDDDDDDESMFILTILVKIKETRLKYSQGNVTIL